MKRIIILWTMATLAFAVGCSGDEAKNAASDAADAAAKAAATAQESASNAMNEAGDAANSLADSARDAAGSAADAASGMADKMGGDAVSMCRKLAESGAWGEALDVCKTAHEMMPDDLGLEHAYQQAMAAAGN